MAWWLVYVVLISSPLWMFLVLEFVRRRRQRPVKVVPKSVLSRGSPAHLYVRGVALEAQFLVAPHRAIVETIELLGRTVGPPAQDVESPEELRKSFEELIQKVRR